MKNPVYTVAALALIVGSGLVHGAWTNRWRTAPALAVLAARLESVPTVLEDWTATSQAIDPRDLAMAGAVGHELRSFRPPSPAGQGPNHPPCGFTERGMGPAAGPRPRIHAGLSLPSRCSRSFTSCGKQAESRLIPKKIVVLSSCLFCSPNSIA